MCQCSRACYSPSLRQDRIIICFGSNGKHWMGCHSHAFNPEVHQSLESMHWAEKNFFSTFEIEHDPEKIFSHTKISFRQRSLLEQLFSTLADLCDDASSAFAKHRNSFRYRLYSFSCSFFRYAAALVISVINTRKKNVSFFYLVLLNPFHCSESLSLPCERTVSHGYRCVVSIAGMYTEGH